MLKNNNGRKPECEKKVLDMRVVMEAWGLEMYTLAVTSNARHFPKKYRFSLCAQLQNAALEISKNLIEANETDLKIKEKRGERRNLQDVAMRKCKVVMHYIELSKKMKLIGDDSFEYWVRMANNVKNMCAKWQSSDLKRAKTIDAHEGGIL
jgi:four helix bundle protein